MPIAKIAYLGAAAAVTALGLYARQPGDIIKGAEKATVVVKTNTDEGEPNTGSGFVISPDGNIITAFHVASGDQHKIFVIFPTGKTLQAKVIGQDEASDISILKVEAKNLPYVQLGNSHTLNQGDKVIEIGTPFGIPFTVTAGIVSALRSYYPDTQGREIVQFDAPTNPGNSGGPVLDERGRVIGMADAIFSTGGPFGGGGNTGISFAIGADTIRKVAADLLAYGRANRPQPRFEFETATTQLASDAPKSGLGARVTKVEAGSAAAELGLKADDVIVRFDKSWVRTASDLGVRLEQSSPGEMHWVQFYRGNRQFNIDLPMGGDIMPKLSGPANG